MKMEPIRIVLAEDHALMRQGTRLILEQFTDLLVVGEAENGAQALELLERFQPDVAILDVRLPKISGIDIVRQMGQLCPNTKALMLTAYDDDDYILALMEAGANGYLLKTAKESELIDAIRAIHLGETVLQPIIAAKVARLWSRRRSFIKDGADDKLSPREMEVLGLAVKGLRNRDIADNLGISVRTVEGHFNNIFTKLKVSSRIEAILCAISQHLIPDR